MDQFKAFKTSGTSKEMIQFDEDIGLKHFGEVQLKTKRQKHSKDYNKYFTKKNTIRCIEHVIFL